MKNSPRLETHCWPHRRRSFLTFLSFSSYKTAAPVIRHLFASQLIARIRLQKFIVLLFLKAVHKFKRTLSKATLHRSQNNAFYGWSFRNPPHNANCNLNVYLISSAAWTTNNLRCKRRVNIQSVLWHLSRLDSEKAGGNLFGPQTHISIHANIPCFVSREIKFEF